MKCGEKGCRFEIEYVKLDTDEAVCGLHLLDRCRDNPRALLEGDAEKCGDWIHRDGADLCVGCEKWIDESETFGCTLCHELACSDCMDERNECQACRDRKADREMVQSIR